MSESAVKAIEGRDLWSLRPGDLPTAAREAPHLRGLEDNAVYRYLIHSHRRHRRERLLLVAVYFAMWLVLGPLYGHYVLGADLLAALSRTAGVLLVLSVGIANVYIFAGIEGYETNGWLKRRFFDVIAAGVPAGEIARGILGKTVSHYPPALVRPLLLGASAGLVAIAMTMPVRESTVLFIWLLFLGIFGAFQLLGAEAMLAWVTIPGTLLWYRGVRRSYEERLAELQGRPRSFLKSVFRLTVFLFVTVSVVLVPVLVYLYAGVAMIPRLGLPWSEPRRMATLAAGFVVFAVSGFVCGRLWGWLAKRSAEGRVKKLESELDRLFRIRGDVLFGGGRGI